jgi:hypothetical protein
VAFSWKVCDVKLSRPIWSTMLIRTSDRGWCHDVIWGALWIGENCEIMLSWLNLKCCVDWNACDRKLSWTIWCTMLIRTDDRRWGYDLIWGAVWIGADSLIMLSWPNLKCYVNWKGCNRKLSQQIWNNLWIITDDRGWCHDVIWVDMWIGTDDIGCCLDQIYIDMYIGKNVTSSFYDHLEVQCGLERMISDDVLT